MPGVAAIREAVADWACACQEECHGRSLVSSAGRLPGAAKCLGQRPCRNGVPGWAGSWVNSAETPARYLAAVIAGHWIAIYDPRDPDVRALLQRHLEFALAQTPPEHSFALDVDGLLDPAITLFGVRVHGSLLGIGAIKRLGRHHAEIKSMHTAEAARGRGIGRAMLTHLLEVARARGFRRVSLETGATAAFAPARALYHSAGFVSCGPFGGYQPSEDNLFMTLELDAAQVPATGTQTGCGPLHGHHHGRGTAT
jgi:putative acetyltransferase